MPGGFQLGYGAANFQSPAIVSGTSSGVTVTPATNAKGAYAVLSSSLPYDSAGIILTFRGQGPRYSIDIAVGGSGSEIVVIPDIYVGSTTSSGLLSVFIPCAIPAGTRVSARAQASAATTATDVTAIFFDGSFDTDAALAFATTYGFTGGSTSGVSVDPGSVSNTKGAWVEIASSITYDIRHLMIGYNPGSTSGSIHWLVDLGVGGSGSEQIVIPNLLLGGFDVHGYKQNFNINIPAGTRIAMRAQCNTGTAGTRLIDFALTGVS